MNKKQIAEEIKRRIPDYLYDFEIEDVEIYDSVKNNNQQMTGLRIIVKDTSVVPCIYIERFIEEYKEDEDEYKISYTELEILTSIISKDFRVAIKEVDGITFEICNFESLKKNIFISIINFEENNEMLKNAPHKRYLDLAIAYRVSIDAFYKEGESIGSIFINNDLINLWGINQDDLYDIAISNIDSKDIYIKSLETVLKEADMLDDILDKYGPVSSPLYLVTNSKCSYGAAVILKKEVRKKLTNIFRGNYYLIPSSINEWLAIPESFTADTDYLKEMIADVNNNVVSRGDILSYSLYFYSSETDTISMV